MSSTPSGNPPDVLLVPEENAVASGTPVPGSSVEHVHITTSSSSAAPSASLAYNNNHSSATEHVAAPPPPPPAYHDYYFCDVHSHTYDAHSPGYDSDDVDMSDLDGGAALTDIGATHAFHHIMDAQGGFSVHQSGENWDGSQNGHPPPAPNPWPAYEVFGPTHVPFQDPMPVDDPTFAQTINFSDVTQHLEQLQADQLEDAGEWADDGGHPVPLTNPNPGTLGPENLGLVNFLHHWAWQARQPLASSVRQSRPPSLAKTTAMAESSVKEVRYTDLEGDACDFQGVNWVELGVTRESARRRRLRTYTNYVNKQDSDKWRVGILSDTAAQTPGSDKQRTQLQPHLPDVVLPRTDNFFKFKRMNIRKNVHLAHFQLRNVLACTSRSDAFYTGATKVYHINPVTGEGRVAMDLSDMAAVQISTLGADCGVLVAGTFNGDYAMRRIHSEDESLAPRHSEGQITSHQSGITNHVQVYESRTSSRPLVAFASNDCGFRVLDLETEKFVHTDIYQTPLNCSAISPDRRLRVMVGDHYNVLVAAADTGEVLQDLSGHRDFGFACAWADDGYTVATGFQDRSVKIWDARRWRDSRGRPSPVKHLRTNMAGARSLRFSPVGSGPRLLVAAEEADYVNIIDARTWSSCQTFDFFGEIGGVSFCGGDAGGDALHILCCDPDRGGLIQLERCGFGNIEAGFDGDQYEYDEYDGDSDRRRNAKYRQTHSRMAETCWPAVAPEGSIFKPNSFDWYSNSTAEFVAAKGPGYPMTRRRRAASKLVPEVPF